MIGCAGEHVIGEVVDFRVAMIWFLGSKQEPDDNHDCHSKKPYDFKRRTNTCSDQTGKRDVVRRLEVRFRIIDFTAKTNLRVKYYIIINAVHLPPEVPQANDAKPLRSSMTPALRSIMTNKDPSVPNIVPFWQFSTIVLAIQPTL